MLKKFVHIFYAVILMVACDSDKPTYIVFEGTEYLNHNDTVKYVGMDACKDCHLANHSTYAFTGMGLSFDFATKKKSASVLGQDSTIYDPYKNLYYHPYWKNDSTLMIDEFRLSNGDTIHKRTEHINYVVGSGQHTNSHIYTVNGYAYQIPFTYYTQSGRLDFPPGFEDGNNSRFSREAELACISCHNGFPDLVMGSVNKYNHIPQGIDCERCHGPGELHVNYANDNILVDTSKHIDYAIVNPARLTKHQVNDLCARCHLQGTLILKEGEDCYGYKPGMALKDYMVTFQPLYEGGEEDFIMASHTERFNQSKCYIESGGDYSCIECHNPHISTTYTIASIYNKTCLNCHQENVNYCTASEEVRKENKNNCVECHMRKNTTRDIPHVMTHDHKITIPQTKEELKTERIFKGIIPVNEPGADSMTMARGYIMHAEAYGIKEQYLDSAAAYLNLNRAIKSDFEFNTFINYYFLRGDYSQIVNLTEKHKIYTVLLEYLTEIEYNNFDAWAAYRIGQSYENIGNNHKAKLFYEKAVELSKYNLEFQNKYGSMLIALGELFKAKEVYQFIISENPQVASAHVNLGYLHLLMGKPEQAKDEYKTVLYLDPDNIMGLLNMAGLYVYLEEPSEAKKYLERALALEPQNEIAQKLLKEL